MPPLLLLLLVVVVVVVVVVIVIVILIIRRAFRPKGVLDNQYVPLLCPRERFTSLFLSPPGDSRSGDTPPPKLTSTLTSTFHNLEFFFNFVISSYFFNYKTQTNISKNIYKKIRFLTQNTTKLPLSYNYNKLRLQLQL